MKKSEALQHAEIGLLADCKEVRPQDHHVPKTTWRMAAISLIVFCIILGIIFAILHEDSLSADRGPEFTNDQPLDALRTVNAPLNVLVVGDWGRKGLYNQSLVAKQMSRVGKELAVDFIVSTGDNFYNSGLTGVTDDNFGKSFTEVYRAESLQKRWYAVLGNHDYRGNQEAQVDKELNKRDRRWWCDYFYTIPVDVGESTTVEFFMIDTNPFIEMYWTEENEKYKWGRITPRQEVIATTLENLSSALEKSNAKWKIVVGHHTMYSYGSHGSTPEMIENFLPILEANKVDMYINGHDHCLQHIKREESDVQFITSGGGSKAWKNEYSKGVENFPDVKLYYDGQGFISISASPSFVDVHFFDLFGTVLHKLSLKK